MSFVTFGFVSDQGVYVDMANASFSVVLNSDMQEIMEEQEASWKSMKREKKGGGKPRALV